MRVGPIDSERIPWSMSLIERPIYCIVCVTHRANDYADYGF
jgi:hypothetical protein